MKILDLIVKSDSMTGKLTSVEIIGRGSILYKGLLSFVPAHLMLTEITFFKIRSFNPVRQVVTEIQFFTEVNNGD